jgi:hypothetical protein
MVYTAHVLYMTFEVGRTNNFPGVVSQRETCSVFTIFLCEAQFQRNGVESTNGWTLSILYIYMWRASAETTDCSYRNYFSYSWWLFTFNVSRFSESHTLPSEYNPRGAGRIKANCIPAWKLFGKFTRIKLQYTLWRTVTLHTTELR